MPEPTADAIKWIDSQVAKRRKAEYDNDQEAFAHVAMSVLLDLDDEEAYEACEVGREIENGPDAFWLDGSGSPGIAAVVAYAPKGRAVGDVSLVSRLSVALERLSPPKGKGRKKALASAPRRLALLHEREAGVPLDAWIVCSGELDDEARKQFKELSKSASDELSFRLIERDELCARGVEALSRDQPAMKEPVTLKLHRHFVYSGDSPAIVASIDALELAELEQQYGYRIFQSNVRYLLKGKQRINDGIARTVNSSAERDNFWYYNNGIAIMCDSFDPPVDNGDTTADLTIHNFQIVNGCQTTATLARTIDALRDADPPVQIIARVVASEDSELRDNIPLYNNSQNAVIPRDLQSNDRVQARLQGEFEAFEPPWFYIRKRGEWESRGDTKRLKKIFENRRIENDSAAQAYFAFYVDAAIARARKRKLFTSTKEDGYYEQIFNAETRPEPLLLAYRAARYVRREVNAYRREVRGLKRGMGAAAEQKKLNKEWLKFGEQYVLGVIGWHVSRHVSMDSPTVKRLATTKFDDFITVAYRVAIGDLTLYFRRVAKEQPLDFEGNRVKVDYANFVKGNWSDVTQTLEVEWLDLRGEQDDPLAGFFS